ncbi:hypothetical protein SAMN03097708_02704 [Thiohalomonas denitrificans]|uniref:Uncharacterized protein n=1 Tax=Thiohalomonas denitrificans TaxID=415747 RepID=A0A1G5QU29_9GAMM|nr:hypothetical protein SAMN03097708_02704 [Thiohalomonas denitrificans]
MDTKADRWRARGSIITVALSAGQHRITEALRTKGVTEQMLQPQTYDRVYTVYLEADPDKLKNTGSVWVFPKSGKGLKGPS